YATGAGAQGFQLLQPQGAVSVSAGETLTLTCSQTGLGSGSGHRLVYADAGSFPRVTRAVRGSDTDFTVHISDTRPEDAGVYHCVKFRTVSGPDEEFRSGSGTAMSVSGECELPPATRPSPPGLVPGRAQQGPFLLIFLPAGETYGTELLISLCESLQPNRDL
uniref:Ig-like domain-containing protein n=1 Tax=Gopherus evgoodei TaxID=1825980 RepID=A0A8C4W832_9SAUR